MNNEEMMNLGKDHQQLLMSPRDNQITSKPLKGITTLIIMHSYQKLKLNQISYLTVLVYRRATDN